MSGLSPTLKLAWRYLSHYRVRTGILVACIALSFLVPFALNLLVDSFSRNLAQRAARTPLVAGAPGSRYDLVLNSLYFRGRVPRATDMRALKELSESGLGTPIPLVVRHAARGFPVVGTSHDYYAFRGLEPATGSLPRVLGEALLGARVARQLELGPGDTLLSDRENLYDLSAGYPLRMRVTGVLKETGGPDDGAVFVDVKTAWIIEGIGHGHQEASAEDEQRVIERSSDGIILSAATREYNEVTPENIASFHFHGEPEQLPLTGILVDPRDDKARTLLKGRYRVSDTAQLLEPALVVAEMLGFVFKLKVFFDANAALVGVATVLFLALVVLLSLRVRQREMETLRKIGAARSFVLRLVATELALTIGAGLGVALCLGSLAALLVQRGLLGI